MIAWCRRIWARLQAREDTEHEQALIRIAVAFAMYAYLLVVPHPAAERDHILWWVTAIFLADLAASLGIVIHILRFPAVNPRRRILAMLVDAFAINGTILLGGTSAAVLYPMLLWIILGHGFRYGRPYLIAAAAVSLSLFSLVVAVSPEWRATPYLAGALVGSLLILPFYFAVLLRKLTDAIARAEEASRAKSQFLATMSHELRTPLNAIIGMSELLGTTRLDLEQRDMTTTIRTAAASLLGMVDEVLDLARIEARRFDIEVEAFDLHDALARVRLMLGSLTAAKGLFLRLRLAPGTPYRLRGGVRSLHQVLVNLVGNAIKFTDQGGVTVRVRPVVREGETVRLRFEVQDTGIGLAPEAKEIIFERFARVEDGRRREVGGTGLGLSIARELVEMMGGSIGVDSRPGEGATFWFEVPLALERPAARERLGGRVVVIGGRDAAAALAERAARLGCETRCVATVEAAAEILRHHDAKAAVLVTERQPPVDLPALAAVLETCSPLEPIDVIAIGTEGDEAAALTLVDLPADVADEVLHAGLRAALRRPAMAGQRRGRDQAPDLGGVRRRLHVLVAEDNRTNQKVIGKLLERSGHRATIVGSGQEAIDALDEPGFDLVLMDINMPGMNGIEAVKLLRFMHPAEALPPIVALSADATPQTREACRAVGFSAYLTKPVDTQLLLHTLGELTGTTMIQLEEGAAASPQDHGPAAALLAVDPGHAALDRAKLASLAELDHGDGFFDHLIDDFIADVQVVVMQIERAAAAGDVRAFRDQAHALRSSAAHIGATALFELCLGWRELDDHALMLRAQAELARLRREVERARLGLLTLKQERRGGRPLRSGTA